MIPRTSILALWLLAATAAIAQDQIPTTTSTSLASTTPTSTASPVTVSTEPTPSSSTTGSGPISESAEYYPSTPGQSYGDDHEATDSDGATGKSDAFIDIPLGAQIGIISAVVVVGVAGVIGCVLWYLRRRRQWEVDTRRSTVPKLAVNARGEFTVGTKGDIPVRAPKLRAPSPADSFDDLTLEKGNVKSEFDSESTKSPPFWRRLFPFSKK